MAGVRVNQVIETAKYLLAVGVLSFLASCTKAAADITAPLVGSNQSGEMVNRVDTDFDGKLGSEIGQCLTATRTVDGRFFGRATKTSFPSRFKNSATTRLVFRGWRAGDFEPVNIIVCTVPRDPDAIELASKRFGGRQMSDSTLKDFAVELGVPQSEKWKKGTRPSLAVHPASIVVIDGVYSHSRGVALDEVGGANNFSSLQQPDDCEDPYFISTECEQYPIDDAVYDTSPDDPFESLETPPLSQDVVNCLARSDNPQRSTLQGTINGNLNAKATSSCSEPISFIAVQTQLWRYRCIWWFCSWLPIAYSLPVVGSVFSYSVFAPATSICAWSDGWYQTRGFHSFTVITVSFPSGQIWNPNTRSPSIRIRC